MTQVVAEMLDVPPQKIWFEEGLIRTEDKTVEVGEAVGWMRQRVSFSWNDRVASKNSGS